MVSLCLEVPPELAQEIGSRENAISFLSEILQKDEYWDHGGPGDGWAPYHVIHILPLIKTKEALELLLETTRDKLDLLDGWITESIPALLGAFGECAIERLKEWVLDEKLDLYIRGSIATALNVIAHQHLDKKEEIKVFLSKLLEDTNNPTFAAFLIDELLSFKDPKFLPQVKKAFEDERIFPVRTSATSERFHIQGQKLMRRRTRIKSAEMIHVHAVQGRNTRSAV